MPIASIAELLAPLRTLRLLSPEQLDALANHPRTKAVDAGRRKKLSTRLADLRKQPAVKAEVAAADSPVQLQAAVAAGKGVPSKLKPLIAEMDALIQKYPRTRAARSAATALEDLRKQVR